MFNKNLKAFIGINKIKNYRLEPIKNCWLTSPNKKRKEVDKSNQCGLQRLILSLPLLLMACGMPTVKLPVSSASSFKSIMVVAIESPPLEVIPDLLESRFPVYRHFYNMDLPLYSEKKLYRYPGGILISGQVVSDDSVELESLKNDPNSLTFAENRPALFNQQYKWMPTFDLASAAVENLTQSKLYTTIGKHYLPLPVSTANLNHWHDAIEQWYASNTTQTNYQQLSSHPVDAVLEIGINQYRIFEGQFSLQVLIKVIDPNTGKVLAKTRQADYSFEASAQSLLQPDGVAFKALNRKMGTRLLNEGFQDIGLIPVIHEVNQLHNNS